MSYIKKLRKKVGKDPIFLVGSTVLVVNINNEILLQLRSDSNDWGLPGGAMELGENFEETARRELLEETNLSCDKLDQIDTFSGKDFYYKYPNGDETYNIIGFFKATGITGELKPNDNESIELRYFRVDNLPELEKRASNILSNINKYL